MDNTSDKFSSDDFSVYVTIMNQSQNIFNIVAQNNSFGTFNPVTLPPLIQAKNQIFFSLTGTLWQGSEGSVTYEVGEGKRITFAFQCPPISNNDLSIPLNQTNFKVDYYGTNQPIQWNPHGGNWGAVNNFPTRGHPLYALFVINSDVAS